MATKISFTMVFVHIRSCEYKIRIINYLFIYKITTPFFKIIFFSKSVKLNLCALIETCKDLREIKKLQQARPEILLNILKQT
jgi:hypothetical protein